MDGTFVERGNRRRADAPPVVVVATALPPPKPTVCDASAIELLASLHPLIASHGPSSKIARDGSSYGRQPVEVADVPEQQLAGHRLAAILINFLRAEHHLRAACRRPFPPVQHADQRQRQREERPERPDSQTRQASFTANAHLSRTTRRRGSVVGRVAAGGAHLPRSPYSTHGVRLSHDLMAQLSHADLAHALALIQRCALGSRWTSTPAAATVTRDPARLSCAIALDHSVASASSADASGVLHPQQRVRHERRQR